MADEICARTDAARVQRLGKILVLWRPKPDEDDVSTASS
jgi:RNA-binding protein YhbY